MTRVSKHPLYMLIRGYLPLPGLNAREVRALQEEALHATWSDGSGCWPSDGTIAQRMGFERSYINKLLKASVALGYLIAEGKGPRGVVKYRVNFQAIMQGVARSVLELAKQVVTWVAGHRQNGATPRQLALAMAVDSEADARASPGAPPP